MTQDITLHSLPVVARRQIWCEYAKSGQLEGRLVSTSDRILFDDALKDLWQALKETNPRGPESIRNWMKYLESRAQKLPNPPNYFTLFKNLVNRITHRECKCYRPLNFLPISPAHFADLQKHLQQHSEDAGLEDIWEEILPPRPKAHEIRARLNRPECQPFLDRVVQLNLEYHQLVVPRELERLSRLEDLWLFCPDNEDEDRPLFEHPQLFSRLTRLQHLCLAGFDLTMVCDSFSHLSQLQSLDIAYSSLRTLPKSIIQLTNLTELNIEMNSIIEIPPSFSTLTSLTELNLEGNKLIEIPEFLRKFTLLEKLFLKGNPILFISPEVLEFINPIFITDTNLIAYDPIENHKLELNHSCNSPLAHLYQAILKRGSEYVIRNLFMQLSRQDQSLILKTAWKMSGHPGAAESEIWEWGKQSLFKDMRELPLSVKETIFVKFFCLPEEKKYQIVNMTISPDWRDEFHRNEEDAYEQINGLQMNLPLIADLVEEAQASSEMKIDSPQEITGYK